MGDLTHESSDSTTELLKRAALGDQEAWGRLLTRNHERLRRMVGLRLDHRLQGRIGPSDVIQDAFLDASAQLPVYLQHPQMPFYLWLRFLTGIRLAKLHRYHLGAQMRDAAREVPVYKPAGIESAAGVLLDGGNEGHVGDNGVFTISKKAKSITR